MAYTVTVLAWGGISYKEAYENADQLDHLKEALKWGTDYFIKAHPDPNTFYGQVNRFMNLVNSSDIKSCPFSIQQ